MAFNPAFPGFIGKDAEYLKGADFAAVALPERSRPAFERSLREMGDGSNPEFRIDSWLAANDEQRPVQWWLTRVEQSPELPSGFVLTAMDLSASREAWERFAEQEARLQSILDTAVDGIVTIDERGIIESINLATERIFGYSPEELIGKNVKVLMPEPYRREHDAYLSNYLNTGHKKIIGIGREVEGRRKDGSTFPLDLAVSEFRVAGQRHFMGLMRDISARKNAEREARRHLEELAHAGRLSALGEMATGIAHEVNQPLTAIVSYAQACLNMLESGNADDALLKATLTQIAAQGRRAGDIVHQLRQLVRKDQGEHGDVDLNDSIRSVLNLVTHELTSSGVEVRLALNSRLPKVHAGRVQIEQVILNLVRNGIDALMDQPANARRLSVSTRAATRDTVEVSITDSGSGAGGEDPERLFEPFYTTKRGGLGVGLSISRSIIEAHGGRLWATEDSGGGLTLQFTLPRRSSDEA